MKLTKGEAFLIKWQYKMHGDFFKALSEAICRADNNNLNKLSKGFPDEVEAYKRFAHEDGYWQGVEKKAKALGEL